MIFLWPANSLTQTVNIEVDGELAWLPTVSSLALRQVLPVVELEATRAIDRDVRRLHSELASTEGRVTKVNTLLRQFVKPSTALL